MAALRPVTRRNLAGIPGYQAGRSALAGPDRPSYKLSANESPEAPLPSVQRVIAESAAMAHLYPEISSQPLRQALGRRWNVPEHDVVAGPGSAGVLRDLVQAYAGEGDQVVYAWRSYEVYPIVVQAAGAESTRIPLDADHRHDLRAMLDSITKGTRIVIVCNPNNPTGTSVRQDELDNFIARVPEDVLVILDEAYREYASNRPVSDGLDYYRARPNVVVLRTFSKAYGLAGLRVGYAIAPAPIADALHATGIPFGVNALGQAAAIASLAVESELVDRVHDLVAERDRVRTALVNAGYRVPQSQANFLWIPTGARTADLFAACAAVRVITRPFGEEGLRVTIGSPEANDAFIRAAVAFRPRLLPSHCEGPRLSEVGPETPLAPHSLLTD